MEILKMFFEKAADFVVIYLFGNRRRLEIFSEDLRKMALLCLGTGLIGYFTQGTIIRISSLEARIYVIAGILIYLIAMSIIAVNDENS